MVQFSHGLCVGRPAQLSFSQFDLQPPSSPAKRAVHQKRPPPQKQDLRPPPAPPARLTDHIPLGGVMGARRGCRSSTSTAGQAL